MSEIPFTDNPILKTDIEDFRKEVFNDILIQTVNFSRATFKEAQEFRDRVVNDILRNNLKIIIDLRRCEYIDSTFLGALVVVLKKITERGGEIKYVAPQAGALYLFKLTGLYGVLNLYYSRKDAIDSFEYLRVETQR
jgi:anti-anti-sigma factor